MGPLRPSVFGTSGGTNRGLPAGVSETLCCLVKKKQTKKGILETQPFRGVLRIFCDFAYVPFLLPIESQGKEEKEHVNRTNFVRCQTSRLSLWEKNTYTHTKTIFSGIFGPKFKANPRWLKVA